MTHTMMSYAEFQQTTCLEDYDHIDSISMLAPAESTCHPCSGKHCLSSTRSTTSKHIKRLTAHGIPYHADSGYNSGHGSGPTHHCDSDRLFELEDSELRPRQGLTCGLLPASSLKRRATTCRQSQITRKRTSVRRGTENVSPLKPHDCLEEEAHDAPLIQIHVGSGEVLHQAYRGQLSLRITKVDGRCGTFSLLILSAKHLMQPSWSEDENDAHSQEPDTFVTVSLEPDETLTSTYMSHLVRGTGSPTYKSQLTFQFSPHDTWKRVCVRVWSANALSSEEKQGPVPDLLGCMSFGVRNLLEDGVSTNAAPGGWFYLLPDELGRRMYLPACNGPEVDSALDPAEPNSYLPEIGSAYDDDFPDLDSLISRHNYATELRPVNSGTSLNPLQGSTTSSSSVFSSHFMPKKTAVYHVAQPLSTSTPSLSSSTSQPRNPHPSPETLLQLPSSTPSTHSSNFHLFTAYLHAGLVTGGYGMALNGSCPVRVSRLEAGGAAEKAGLRPGDLVVSVEGDCVEERDHHQVAALIRRMSKQGRRVVKVTVCRYQTVLGVV